MIKLLKEGAIVGTAMNLMFVVWIFTVWETQLSFDVMFITMINSGAFWYAVIVFYLTVIGLWVVVGDLFAIFRRYKESGKLIQLETLD